MTRHLPIQADLFETETPPICGECVTFNAYHGDRPDHPNLGGCSIHGLRSSSASACERWFPKHQLRMALYGRGA